MKFAIASVLAAVVGASRSAEGSPIGALADAVDPAAADAGGLRGKNAPVDAPRPGAAARSTSRGDPRPRGTRSLGAAPDNAPGRRALNGETTSYNMDMINLPARSIKYNVGSDAVLTDLIMDHLRTQGVLDGDRSYNVDNKELDMVFSPVPVAVAVGICLVGRGFDLCSLDLPDNGKGDVGVTGHSFVSTDWGIDADGQGTHIAGIIGGSRGILPDPDTYRFHVVKLSSNPTSEQAEGAIDNCLDNGANIISFSSRVPAGDEALKKAFRRAYDKGALVIAPAGNDQYHTSAGVYPTVVSVASVKKDGSHSGSSNRNVQIELSAPGVDILSTCTYPDPAYCLKSGTEYAAAHVVGVAALLMGLFPDCTNNQIRNTMLRSASKPPEDARGPNGWDVSYGRGILNAGSAVALLEREGCAGAGGPDPAAQEAPSDLALGGQWQGCGTEGVGKCGTDNDWFLPCCQGISCAILTEHKEGWCGCAPKGEVCSLENSSDSLTCCEGYECVTPSGKSGVKVCQEATGDVE